MKNQPRYPQSQFVSPIELLVVITNGDPVYDTKLRFEFTREGNEAQVWLARLPRLKNYDAFPRQLSAKTWELRLAAEGETHPIQLLNYKPETARLWLKDVFQRDGKPPHCELLILAHHNQFTISLQHFSN